MDGGKAVEGNSNSSNTKKELKAWNKEKKLIPVMIKKYCRGNHKSQRKEQGVARREVCLECKELTEFALFRLDKCPFKVNKKFCSFCKIHCYKPDMRAKIKEVMKYSGQRMLVGHPIFAISHVVQMIKYKKQNKVKDEEDGKGGKS
ncbi:MAG: nitrous oxide-stimulated promoter family protein [Clostridia bacterium]|nr:nitrous oxide-stimulated promoter family protein [Clostridia bacterium]